MTAHERRVARITWPLVVLAAIGGAFFIGLYALTQDETSRVALIGLLVSSVGSVIAVIVQRLSNKVERVQEQMDGGGDADRES